MRTATEKLRLSEISPRIMQSEIRSMTVECERIGGVNLAQGVCDTEIPSPVVENAIKAIHDGHNIYTRMDGIMPLRQAIAHKLAHYNGIHVDPDSEVLVTSGATAGLYAACLALFDPGDEVVLFEPFYGYHVNTLLSLRIQPRVVPLAMHSWEIDFDALNAAITPRTRAIIVNSPSNPCGKVFTHAEFEKIAILAEEHDLFLLTDEIYEYFLFDGAAHISPASLPGMAERTITISGLSKTFSITGWRIGYLAADKRWLGSIAYFHDLTYVCAPSPFQYGSVAGLVELPDSFYAQLATEYQAKRDMLCSALQDVGFTPSIPQGAYYVLADVGSVTGATAREKARRLLAETGVAAVAGTAFFTEGRGEEILRFCFAKRDEDLERACKALRSYRA
ncbi:MAG TPA: aminotransferase class I/II-fold pyridoxal phosphate-dependent enzyme [Alloacidobacterium sp.]|nr:aminotransferase class I/II-fold pyridoxal phosphate-dependent enzyme [Alloacidobacterium sp.]